MERDTTLKTYSIDKKVAQAFTDQTPKQKTSQKLEDLMREHIDQDLDQTKKPVKHTDPNIVSDQRKKLLEIIIEEDLWFKSLPQVRNRLKSKGMYSGGAGKHHFKQALKFLSNLDDSGVVKDDQQVKPEKFECRDDSCSCKLLDLVRLSDNDFNCPACGRRYEL